jgi:hypothetical protein
MNLLGALAVFRCPFNPCPLFYTVVVVVVVAVLLLLRSLLAKNKGSNSQ